LITQNIDGLHQLAGNSPDVVVEIHGTVRKVRCMSCTYLVDMSIVLERLRCGEDDPSCPDCSGILKSATISFGQNLVPEDLVRSESAAKLSVYPAASVVPIAKQSGARIIIINGGPTDLDGIADAVLRGQISELLPSIVPSAH
jgi:NAD-dependent deacetylase